MTQKSKRSATPWVLCEKCSINILSKDIELHSSDCPPNLSTFSYSFVKEEVLYGTLDMKTNEDIKHLSSKERDKLVFLSQSAIQLCSLAIGESVILRLVDSAVPPIAKVVWPTGEKSLASVLLTRNSLDLNFMNVADTTVTVSKVPHNIPPGNCISLIILNAPKSLEITSELYNRVSKSNIGQILTIGNVISVLFYGKMLKFEVKLVVTNHNKANLESDFSKLHICDSEHEFCMATETTKWNIYSNLDQYKKEVVESSRDNKIAGVDEEMDEIRDIVNVALMKMKISPLARSKSVLLYGHSGTGKTTIANSVAKELDVNIVSISAPDIYSKYSGSVEEHIRELFQNAIDHQPSVIILDEIDILCPSRSSRITDTEKRVVSTLLLLFDNLNNLNCKIFIIATTNKLDNIEPSFRRCGRLDREIEIPTPNPKSRKAILEKLLCDIPNSLNAAELQEISMNTHGFVGADLVSLCSRAGLNASKRDEDNVSAADFKFALKKVRPSAMREVQIEVPNVKWSDIGGQENLKLILKQAVEWPLKYSESFSRLGITPPKGVLMFGPPGCSKTMIAKALATESGLNFLSIKGPELFSKWVGESEKAVREVFRKARQVAPSIIFFDEIDALGGERSSGSSTSVQERVLAQLLTELDGVSPLGDVTILAATNRPDRIDKALLRPGRLDRIVYVPLPDKTTRREIFRIKLSKMPVVNISIDDLVEKTEGYSGAEANAVCHEAAMMALEESLDIQHIETRHFERALKLITPRISPSLIKLYDDYINK